MSKASVTVVMSPRERFSLTRRTLESLCADPGMDFEFICIDGGSPAPVRDYLRRESERRGFKLVRKPYYLKPNEARNLIYDDIRTDYVAFIDNDVEFAPGWLKYLVECAEETGASVISPLICIYEPVHTIVHMAGGEARFEVKDGKRIFREKHFFYDRPVAEVKDKLIRRPIDLAEFHCMLVRTDMLKKMGRFDEGLTATSEHADFCLTALKHGALIMLEPRSVVTNVVGPKLGLLELPHFFWRWNRKDCLASERYFFNKWNAEYNDDVFRFFVLKHRRHALPRFREFVRSIIGWRLSEWSMERLADVLGWFTMRYNEFRRVMSRSKPVQQDRPMQEATA